MPVVQRSDYVSPKWLFNSHLQTIIPAGLRKVKLKSPPTRFRVVTDDEDFLDVDHFQNNSSKVVIISHGLEGNSARPYMKGMVNAMLMAGYDVIAWNYRGCSGEINRALRMYHSGATDDLYKIVSKAKDLQYTSIFLVGFSLGGNLTLKFLGEYASDATMPIRGGVVFSVPMDLKACSLKIEQRENFIYSTRFLKSLKEKIRLKSMQYPERIDLRPLNDIKTVYEIDDYFTAPLHGFKDAEDYYELCSSIHFIEHINVPTLVVNALNDPFLAGECFSSEPFGHSDHVYLELPAQGGHCGFASYDASGMFWSEKRAVSFFQSIESE